MKSGVLLVNTGSPDSASPDSVKNYLREFLMDERVIDIPRWKRQLLVYGIIAPFRSKKSASLYQHIWTTAGSPLIVFTRELAKKVSQKTGIPVYTAMRYGKPGILQTLEQMQADKIKKIILIPMFPHYAMSTYESVVEKVKMEYSGFAFSSLKVVDPYYKNPQYINSLYENAQPYLKQKFDHIVLSYHSLPERHIRKMDKSGVHCLVENNCCETEHPARNMCYKAQTMETTRLFISKAGIAPEICSHTYQSAMNLKTWLKPDTESVLHAIASNGKNNILVICPGFVTDNLETLEEIGIRAKASALQTGVREFTLIPSLNAHESWVNTLSGWIINAQ
ncbi:MAG: ferrochelatase [Spirochaetia bacterium]|nr:ferrochelatase [Spirochaetia bacterium]